MPRCGKTIRMPDGSWMHIDYTMPAPKPCYLCGRPGVALCDWPDATHLKTGTCDHSLCKVHAMKPISTFGELKTADIDYCPEHYELYKKQMLEVKRDNPLEP